MAEVARLNEQELQQNLPDSASWHNDYKDTAWVRIRNLPFDLSEGDLLCVFSQFGEIEDIKLIRNSENGRSTGLCFVKFERAKSAWLTVDNFNQTTLLGRTIQVDHHREVFRRGKRHEGMSFEELLKEVAPGSYYREKEIKGEHTLEKGVNVYDRPVDQVSTWKAEGSIDRLGPVTADDDDDDGDGEDGKRSKRKRERKEKKDKKEKKERKEKKSKKHKRERVDSDSD